MVNPEVGTLTCPLNRICMRGMAVNVAENSVLLVNSRTPWRYEVTPVPQNVVDQDYVKDQIQSVGVKSRKGSTHFAINEYVRFDCTWDDLTKLRPVFSAHGPVTTGSASCINDAAASIVMMDCEG